MASIEELKAKANEQNDSAIGGVEVGDAGSEPTTSSLTPKKKGHTVIRANGGGPAPEPVDEVEEEVEEDLGENFGVEVGEEEIVEAEVPDDLEEVDDEEEDYEEENDQVEVETDEYGIPIGSLPEETIKNVPEETKKVIEETGAVFDDEDEDDDGGQVVYSSSIAEQVIDDDDDEKESTKTDEEDDDIDTEEIQKHFVEIATERFKPISKSLDISSFTVVKEPTTNITALEEKASNRPARPWVAFSQQTAISMMQFSGDELDLLRTYTMEARGNGAPAATAAHNRFRMIYDHIASPKPSTYEAWAKSTPFTDIDDYFFNIYVANFKDTNFIPADCENEKCRNAFLTEDIPIMDMVKFPNDEVKAKFKEIYKSEPAANSKGLYVSETIPVSDTLAIGFREPSIYSVIQAQFIDEAFSEKYASTIGFIPFIDAIYIIDKEAKTLRPIGYKAYAGSERKTFKSKVRQFSIALKTLGNDQFELLHAYTNKLSERIERPSYQNPEIECPKCGSKIPATDTRAEDLVFSRYQLAAIVNTPLN